MSGEAQTYKWRMNPQTFHRYSDLVNRLMQEEEWSEPYCILLDEVKSLPGYPNSINPDIDNLDIICVVPSQVGYTGSIN
jgi:hypothetical protein